MCPKDEAQDPTSSPRYSPPPFKVVGHGHERRLPRNTPSTCSLHAINAVDGMAKEKKKAPKPLLEVAGDSKFARALGSVDYSTRERGLQALTQWLSKRPDLTETDLIKIWKGIFYCFWHSDLQPVQVREHAELLPPDAQLWTLCA